MALDIHWALQEIVDYLDDEHSLNSFNDQGININAYIHFGNLYDQDLPDNAGYDPNFNVVYFGDGYVKYRPIASLDAVAHEFGHGITDFQIGWGLSGDPLAFHEGLSDIWAIILESRINPNYIWQIGEEITLNHGCTRNIADPDGNNPALEIADTYLSTHYNDTSLPEAVPYIRGGVFSHWFYLLVNGGTGTNGIYDDYTVYGIGMDAAEDLLLEAVVNNYLDNVTTYPEVRQAMVDAAEEIFGDTMQVANAWYAVGVGTEPTQVYLSGPSIVCSNGTAMTVNYLPANASIIWNNGSYITRSSAQGSNPCAFTSTGYGSSWIEATLHMDYADITLPKKYVNVSASPHDLELYCEGGDGGPVGYSYPLYITPFYTNDVISWGSYPAASITDIGGGYASIYFNSPENYTIWAYTNNGCGPGNYAYTYFYAYDYDFPLSPNPATNEVEVMVNDGIAENLKSGNPENDEYTVTITDVNGITKSKKKYKGKQFTIPIQNLKDGNYFVNLSNDKMNKAKQLVIKRQ